MKTEPSNLSIFPTIAAIGIGLATFSGCASQTAVTTAYKSEAAADAAVGTAMSAWGAYVSANHPPVSQEWAVQKAFNDYQQAELAAIDATTAYASAAGSNSVAQTQSEAAAMTAASTALTELINLASQFETSTNK
jgi:thiamine biosynthesis lipoprotein ApbE